MEEKKKKLPAVFWVILAVIAVFVGFYIVIRIAFVPVNISRFSDEQVAEIGQEYNMDMSDVKLKRYRHVTVQDSLSECIFVVDDFRSFMENSFMGEILDVDELGNDEFAYRCRPYEDVEGQRKSRIYVSFTKTDDGWQAKLSHYRYVV